MKQIISIIVGTLLSMSASAAITKKSVEYKEGDTVLEGYWAIPEGATGKAPTVLVVHDWMGLGDYPKMRADQIAELGYIAFAVDIYGKDTRPKDQKEAAEFAGQYRNGDRKLMRKRIQAALDEVKKEKLVDPKKIAVIGYCFGGTVALELARSGATLAGAVSFHGGLSTPNPKDAKKIKGKILALHGADDPFVPATEVMAFEEEMRAGKVDWQLVAYGNSVHAFTQKAAGNDNSKGSAYNEKADKRSWIAMREFFAEIFKK